MLLDTQYRMHPDIADLPSRLFYSGKLRSGVPPAERPPPRVSSHSPKMSHSETRSAASFVILVRFTVSVYHAHNTFVCVAGCAMAKPASACRAAAV